MNKNTPLYLRALTNQLTEAFTRAAQKVTKNKKAMDEKLSMGRDKALPPPLPDPEEYTVEFDDNDPSCPHNWTTCTK